MGHKIDRKTQSHTFIDARVSNISNGRGVHNVTNNEAFDSFVFGNQNSGLFTANSSDLEDDAQKVVSLAKNTCPRPFFERPLFLRFFVIFVQPPKWNPEMRLIVSLAVVVNNELPRIEAYTKSSP